MITSDQFESAVHGYRHVLIGRAQMILRNKEDAEDAVQESLAKAWSKREQFQGGAKLSTWMQAIVSNQSLSEIRKRKSRHYNETEEIGELAVEDTRVEQITQERFQQSRLRLIQQGMSRLSSPERALIAMILSGGSPRSSNAIKIRKWRAIKKLRAFIGAAQ